MAQSSKCITGIWTMQIKDETLEIQNERKHENQVNEKIQDMYTTSLWKPYPHKNVKRTATRLHVDARAEIETMSMRNRTPQF